MKKLIKELDKEMDFVKSTLDNDNISWIEALEIAKNSLDDMACWIDEALKEEIEELEAKGGVL